MSGFVIEDQHGCRMGSDIAIYFHKRQKQKHKQRNYTEERLIEFVMDSHIKRSIPAFSFCPRQPPWVDDLMWRPSCLLPWTRTCKMCHHWVFLFLVHLTIIVTMGMNGEVKLVRVCFLPRLPGFSCECMRSRSSALERSQLGGIRKFQLRGRAYGEKGDMVNWTGNL